MASPPSVAFEVRLESPSSLDAKGRPHYRIVSGLFLGEAHAREWCERKEFALCAFQLPPGELVRLKELEDTRRILGTDRARLATHRQSEPYEVVSVARKTGRGE